MTDDFRSGMVMGWPAEQLAGNRWTHVDRTRWRKRLRDALAGQADLAAKLIDESRAML